MTRLFEFSSGGRPFFLRAFSCVSAVKLQTGPTCQLRCGHEEETRVISAALSCLALSLFLSVSLFHLHWISTMILVTHETPESFYIIIPRRVIKKDSPIGIETPSPPSNSPPNQVNVVINDI